MKEELDLDCPYKIFRDTKESYYFFDTKLNIRYIMYLTGTGYFENFHLHYNIYEFGFERKNVDNQNKVNKKNTDQNVHLTILAFLSEFFKKTENVLTFVTDITGAKQEARSRLFAIWKNKFDPENKLEKYDIEIENNDETYFSSMIIRNDNIHKSEYQEEFFRIANELTK